MRIDMVERTTGMGRLETAHGALNAAFNALAVDGADTVLARGYVAEAREAMLAIGGEDAAHAARAVLPRLEHAVQLLDTLGVAPDPEHVAPLLDELGIAMDHVEQALAGAGWD